MKANLKICSVAPVYALVLLIVVKQIADLIRKCIFLHVSCWSHLAMLTLSQDCEPLSHGLITQRKEFDLSSNYKYDTISRSNENIFSQSFFDIFFFWLKFVNRVHVFLFPCQLCHELLYCSRLTFVNALNMIANGQSFRTDHSHICFETFINGNLTTYKKL